MTVSVSPLILNLDFFLNQSIRLSTATLVFFLYVFLIDISLYLFVFTFIFYRNIHKQRVFKFHWQKLRIDYLNNAALFIVLIFYLKWSYMNLSFLFFNKYFDSKYEEKTMEMSWSVTSFIVIPLFQYIISKLRFCFNLSFYESFESCLFTIEWHTGSK